jgi:hypothetical protein
MCQHFARGQRRRQRQPLPNVHRHAVSYVGRQPTSLTFSSFLPAFIGLPPMPQRVMRLKRAPVTCRKGGGE